MVRPASAWFLLFGLVSVSTSSPPATVTVPEPGSLLLGNDFEGVLRDQVLISLLSQRGEDEEYTKLEKMLVDALLKFRDSMTKPQPALGLPTLDPFVYDGTKTFTINSTVASMNATLLRVGSTGASKFEVTQLSLYLIEREGVLDLSVPDFAIEVTVDVPEGSWVSPFKVPLNDKLTLRYTSSNVSIDYQAKISVKDGRLSMESTKINLASDEWKLKISTDPARKGTMEQNPGLSQLLPAVLHNLAPVLMEDWMPVLEKIINTEINEQLQKLQLDDLLPHHD